MIKVRATGASRMYGKTIKELGRIANPGEEFFVTPERLEVLLGKNPYFLCTVERVDEDQPVVEVKPVVEEIVEEKAEVVKEEIPTPKKTTTKKKTTKK